MGLRRGGGELAKGREWIVELNERKKKSDSVENKSKNKTKILYNKV